MTNLTVTSKEASIRVVAHAEDPPRTSYQVVCVCGGCGFPLTASAARIINVGKALQAGGIDFRLLHCGPSPVPLNTRRSGIYQGIPFEYTTGLYRPKNFFVRLPVYLRALIGLTYRLLCLRPLRHRTAVYIYVMDGPLVLYTGILCRLLGFCVVQEMCEWFPADPHRRMFTQWLYRKPIFAQATGILAISRLLERRVRERSVVANPRLLVHLLPSMVDSERFINASPDRTSNTPYFLWCGVGYTEDVMFLIRVLALVNREGYRCKLRIISAAFLAWVPQTIRDYAAKQGLPPDAIDLMGCVDDRTLEISYKSAAALLLPLWDDEKSRARMPNKLAEYLASGRPAITCKVGDLLEFLVDGVNAYLGEAGNEREFANNMIAVLRDPARANRIGAAGQQTCIDRLDYRSQTESLSKFVIQCIESHRQASR